MGFKIVDHGTDKKMGITCSATQSTSQSTLECPLKIELPREVRSRPVKSRQTYINITSIDETLDEKYKGKDAPG